ncbi:molybdenum cofactor guanylyltransferase [Desulfitobacterium sp. Sab5]|uniref:molybdenum cofactor guanylyltransferase n=1 Tax=Desulfitobacterium nosdiversum TaxID=3375356 RepID=UPI003CEE5E9F
MALRKNTGYSFYRDVFSQRGGFIILDFTGILLAGGKSSRMGKNKAFLELNGKPFIEKNLEILQLIFSEVFISSNTPELYSQYKVRVVQDHYVEHGPLGGIQACLQEAVSEFCFIAACDIPFLNPDLIHFMASLTERYDIVAPKTAGGIHPLYAFYKRSSCLPKIEKSLKAGILKTIDFFDQCSVRYISESEIERFGNVQLLLYNVNTPEEWVKFQMEWEKAKGFAQDKYRC